jgi:hypothetical protein
MGLRQSVPSARIGIFRLPCQSYLKITRALFQLHQTFAHGSNGALAFAIIGGIKMGNGDKGAVGERGEQFFFRPFTAHGASFQKKPPFRQAANRAGSRYPANAENTVCNHNISVSQEQLIAFMPMPRHYYGVYTNTKSHHTRPSRLRRLPCCKSKRPK